MSYYILLSHQITLFIIYFAYLSPGFPSLTYTTRFLKNVKEKRGFGELDSNKLSELKYEITEENVFKVFRKTN